MKQRNFIFVLLFILLSLAVGLASAQTGKNGPMAKLTHSLVKLHDQYTTHLAQRSTASFSSGDPLIKLVEDRVVVDAVTSGDVNVLKADLEFLGMQQAVSFGRIVSGQLPVSSLPAAAGMVSVQFVQPATAITNIGSVTSQGDTAMGSNLARATFSVDGSGVTVGALSDSFNCLGGAAADITSGDLSPVTVIQEHTSCSGVTDEGRALLQVVHDVAPGSGLAFASAFNGVAAFATNIQSLAAAGAKVIVDDVTYLAEPFFQDGIIAQAVNNVVAGGAAYFSSAGNQARKSYQNAFKAGPVFAPGSIPSAPGAPPFAGGTAHNFDPSGGTDVFQRITLPPGAGFIMSFQWDSPAFSVSGAPGSTNDLDVYVLNAAANQIVGGANIDNLGNDPVEVFSFVNTTGATADFNIMIVKFAGSNPGLMKYILFNFNGTIQEFVTDSGTVFGHANAVGAEAVGAARYTQTPAFGVSPPVLETFSSSGATPILFDLAGNRLATAEIRAKPEIVAPDGGDTTFFGSDTDGNGFPNFFGTSAAAPHAAGVAALILQARPSSTPLQIYAALENTAIDMGAPGFDYDTGFGLIQADAALEDALRSLAINDVAVVEGNSGTVNAVFTVTLTTASAQSVTVHFATADNTATAGSDYVSNSGVLTFNPGETSRNITVVVNGDTVNEADEAFFVNLTSATNATITDSQGVGTINNDDALPSLAINDVAVVEGNSGTVNAVFTVTLSPASGQSVTVNFATADGTATAGSDYVATSGTLTFNPGDTTKTITVLVSGDTVVEPDETFFVNLTAATNATIADGQGAGTINNDDALPSLAINDVAVVEGNSGTVNAVFTVTLMPASAQTVTVSYSTANGSATAVSDYVATSGTLTFNPGETTKIITVLVNSDTVVEPDETFFVNLTSATNATIADGQGVGTIVNDDINFDIERLGNISTRGRVLTGDNVMIGGFIIEGSAPKRVLVRSRGPSMSGAPFFVPGTLANPLLQLFSGSTVIAQNDNWQDAASCSGFDCGEATAIAATGLSPCTANPGQAGPPPNCALEAAILITLPPGGYTGIVTGADGGTGVGLVEVFEADASPLSELSNISTRGFVQSGDNVMIGGLIIEGTAPKTVLIRARGPSMSGAPFSLNGTLANPLVELYSGQTVIAFNDNWRDLQEDEIIATGLDPCQPNPGQAAAPPGCDQESAMVLDLPAGGYTAIVSGVGGLTGIGLVEIFEVPDVIIPNDLGNYAGSASVTLSNCQNPANNQSNNFSLMMNVSSQNGSLIAVTGTLSGPVSVNLNISGTATAGADVMGSVTFTQPGASGSGRFIGSFTGNTLTLNFTGQFTSGESCTVNGSLSGIR